MLKRDETASTREQKQHLQGPEVLFPDRHTHIYIHTYVLYTFYTKLKVYRKHTLYSKHLVTAI